MADLPSTPQPGEPLVYRPISVLALFGFVLASLFAAIVLITSSVALVEGLPLFLPGWVFVLAMAAAAVCFLAQTRIRNSEGGLAGLALARFGLWLSILLGVTYFVFTWVTGLALTKQANDFLMIKSDEDTGFFPRLQNAGKNRTDLFQAFLFTLPTTSRGGSKAENEERMLSQYDQPGKDGEPGAIGKFGRNPLVLFLSKSRETILIEPLGVVEWRYEGNCYHVLRNYRFTTSEVVIETPVPVQSSEGAREGEQRKWFVPITKMPRFIVKSTPYGKNLLDLRSDSKVFVEKWREQFQESAPGMNKAPMYTETDTDWNKVLPKKDQREYIKQVLADIFRGEQKAPQQMVFITDDTFADWKAVDGRIQIVHSLQMSLPAANNFPAFNLELEFVVATKDLVDLAAPLRLPLSWEIRNIRLLRAAVSEKRTGRR